MSMLKRIKHSATVMVGSMKQGKDSATSLDPEFEVEKTHFKEFRDDLHGFIEDATHILKALPRVFKSASDLTALTQKCFETFPEEDRDLSSRLSILTTDIQLFVNARTGDEGIDVIVRPLRELVQTMDELGAVAKNQHDSFLILEQNKSRLESLQKDGEKNAQQIEIYTEKVRTRTLEVEQLEREFIGRMQAAWTNRFTVLGGPLKALLSLITETGQALRTATEPIIELLGEDVLSVQYTAVVPTETKGKK
jgi:hypothetical protein